MRRLLLAIVLLVGGTLSCFSQTSVLPSYRNATGSGSTEVSVANPLPTTATLGVAALTTTQAKVTVAVTNTYQQALASSAGRKGCTLQYIAVAGSKGYVFFGASPADTTTSWQLSNGQSINCAVGGLGVATDAVQVTATGTDIFVVSNQ